MVVYGFVFFASVCNQHPEASRWLVCLTDGDDLGSRAHNARGESLHAEKSDEARYRQRETSTIQGAQIRPKRSLTHGERTRCPRKAAFLCRIFYNVPKTPTRVLTGILTMLMAVSTGSGASTWSRTGFI